MAPSLRDLIDFLLAEIALCGDQGQSFASLHPASPIFSAIRWRRSLLIPPAQAIPYHIIFPELLATMIPCDSACAQT